MQRRDFIALVSGSAIACISGPPTATAQTRSKVYRLSTISPRESLDDRSPFGSILVRVPAERGYVLGQNLALDARGAKGDMRRVPEFVKELANKVDAFPVQGFPLSAAAKATGIPAVGILQ